MRKVPFESDHKVYYCVVEWYRTIHVLVNGFYLSEIVYILPGSVVLVTVDCTIQY